MPCAMIGELPELKASGFEETWRAFFHTSRPVLSKQANTSVPNSATMYCPSVAGVALAYEESSWRCI